MAIAINQPDLTDAEVWLAFSFDVAARYNFPAPTERACPDNLR